GVVVAVSPALCAVDDTGPRLTDDHARVAGRAWLDMRQIGADHAASATVGLVHQDRLAARDERVTITPTTLTLVFARGDAAAPPALGAGGVQVHPVGHAVVAASAAVPLVLL